MGRKIKTVAVAGHFNPLHAGHLKMFREAKKFGDRLIVILANDEQTELKHGKGFMDYFNRYEIIRSLSMVDNVIKSIDKGSDVSLTIKEYRNIIDVFCSGCRSDHPDALREKETCRKYGILTKYNVGGKKIYSSSRIVEKCHHIFIDRDHKIEGLKFFTPDYYPLQIGIHEPSEDREVKLHKHTEIAEMLYVERGEIEVTTTDDKFGFIKTTKMKQGDSVTLFKGGHAVKLPKGCRVLEVKSGPYKDDKIYA